DQLRRGLSRTDVAAGLCSVEGSKGNHPSKPIKPSTPGFIGLPGWFSIRDAVQHIPVDPQFADGVNKVAEIHRLHEVTVDAKFVALGDVAFFLRRREHHDGDVAGSI